MGKKEKDPNLNTAYDDVFRTMTVDCSQLLLPVLNEIFGKHYTGEEKIVFGQNEHFLNRQAGNEQKRITDSMFNVIGKEVDKYLYECESKFDRTVTIRIFEYLTQEALDSGEIKGRKLIVTIPNAAILVLRGPKKMPDQMEIEIKAPRGSLTLDVRLMKIRDYSIEDIFEKKLYFLIPFYIFTHEKDLKRIDKDEDALAELLREYQWIIEQLEQAREKGELTAFAWLTIRDMSKKVVDKIAMKYRNVKEGVKEVMGGRVLEYEAKTIYNEGRTEGWNEGRTEGWNEGRTEGWNEGRTEEKKTMVRNLSGLGLSPDFIAKAAGVSEAIIREWIETTANSPAANEVFSVKREE
ncbi:MAG: hypothetical protein IJI57_13295 [Flexilinea sp.]|nr:hypothetical protein [Flexilinea sp.]